MNKAIRTLAISGLGLLAGAGLGAPALAVDGTATTAAKSPTSVVVQNYLPGATEVVSFYRTKRGCERAGWMGERRGFWNGHACRLVRVGVRSGAWALQVNRADWRWGTPGFRDFYSGNKFRFQNDGFLGYGPRFGGWVRGPIANGPWGYYGGGKGGNYGGGSYGGGGNYGGGKGGSYGDGGSSYGDGGSSYGDGGGKYGDGGSSYGGEFGAGKTTAK